MAVRVGDDGSPQVTAERLRAAYDAQSDFLKNNYLTKFAASNMEELAQKLNRRLGTIRLEAVTAIFGEGQFSRADRKSAIEAFDASDMAQLAYGDQLNVLDAWLASAEPEKVMALLRS